MSKATLTMIGLYNWDPDLFKNLVLPDGIDRNTTIDCILLQSGEFEVLYSDCDFMENAIGYVSRKWQRTFQKWYEALQLEYHPIENYDRYEEWTDEGTNTGTVKRGTSRNSSSTGSETSKASSSEDVTGSNSENVSGSTTESVTGSNSENVKESSSDQSSSTSQTDTFGSTYDSNALNQDNQSKSTQSANSSGSTSQDTTGSSKQDTTGSSKQDTTRSSSQRTTGSDEKNTNSTGSVSETGSDDETRDLGTSGRHEGHLHGNIGVTTSQEMLQAELDIDNWNLYEHIADIFVRELCIPVY